jgi:hypothetical protein
MTDVGYGRSPKHSQFKKGVCPNPRGRGKRRDLEFASLASLALRPGHNALHGREAWRHPGKRDRGRRREVLTPLTLVRIQVPLADVA